MEYKKDSLKSNKDCDSNSKMEDKLSVKSQDLKDNEVNDKERKINDKILLTNETIQKGDKINNDQKRSTEKLHKNKKNQDPINQGIKPIGKNIYEISKGPSTELNPNSNASFKMVDNNKPPQKKTLLKIYLIKTKIWIY